VELQADTDRGEGLLWEDMMMASFPVLQSGFPAEMGLTSLASQSSPPRLRTVFSIELRRT